MDEMMNNPQNPEGYPEQEPYPEDIPQNIPEEIPEQAQPTAPQPPLPPQGMPQQNRPPYPPHGRPPYPQGAPQQGRPPFPPQGQPPHPQGMPQQGRPPFPPQGQPPYPQNPMQGGRPPYPPQGRMPLPQGAATPGFPPMQPQDPNRPITKEEAEHCRHKLEKRWYRRLIELNVLAIIVVIVAVCVHIPDYIENYKEVYSTMYSEMSGGEDSADSSDSSDSDTEKDSKKTKKKDKDKEQDEDSDSDGEEKSLQELMQEQSENTPLELQLFWYGVFLLIFGYLGLYYYYASVRAMSLKITPRNFPEIYELIQSYAHRLGMEKVPDAYVVQQNGVLNAFSSFIPHRQYIQINSEVFEVAYREHKDMDSLAFIIAHEISHIYYGHATLHYNVPIWFSMNFPIFGAIASRTREYSCDRLAQHLTGNDGMDAMFMLIVDRHLYKKVDKIDYLENTAKETGFFLFLVNLLSSHPIMTKRIRALAMRDGSGELY